METINKEEMERLIFRQIDRHKKAIKELQEDWTELNSEVRNSSQP